MSLVVTGSVAYDHIMVFPDEFRKHILPDKVHMLSVCFNVDRLSKEYGGTAGNIAYTLSQLGVVPLLVATVGQDFGPYRKHLEALDIDTSGVLELEDEMTAQAFITTDLQDNQISAFHGGAMFRAHERDLSVVEERPQAVIISPNGFEAMVQHARYCRDKGWSFWADPGQSLSALSSDQLKDLIQDAEGLLVNDYEWELFQQKTGLGLKEVLSATQAVVETRGEQGVILHTEKGSESVAAVSGVKVVDPTGAGDAFRAGLLYALQQGMDLVSSARYACAVASFAVEQNGTQNHQFTLPAVEERFQSIT